MKNKRPKSILAVLCGLLAVFFIWDAKSRVRTEPVEIQIADKKFVLPVNFKNWQYKRISNDNGVYKQLSFILNTDTFRPIKAEYGDGITTNFHVELRPMASEFGEKKFWTKDDPIYKIDPKNCKDYSLSDNEYLFCEQGRKIRLDSWGDDFYSIRDKKTGEYIAIIGCADFSPHGNAVCSGRARILDNLQVEYLYRREHFNRAVEFDHRARVLILSLYKPQQGEKVK